MALGGTNFKLRSSTHNDPYASFKRVAAAIYTAGEMVKLNDTVGVMVNAAAIGANVVFVYWASKILVPCAAVTTGNLTDHAPGSKVYFDAADKEVNVSSGGNTLCGIVVKQPAIGDETVLIHLDGMLGIVS